MNEQMLMTTEAKIAQPRLVTLSPVLVNPSMVKVSAENCWLIQATNSKRDPLITREIRPKVSMYRGIAITLITGAITAFITPNTAPMTKRLPISCQMPFPP